MASLKDVLSFFHSGFQRQDVSGLITVFLSDPSQSDFAQLRAQLQSIPFDQITSILDADRVLHSDSRINESAAAVVRDFFRYVRDYGTPPERSNDTSIARLRRDFKNFDGLTQRIADFYKLQTSVWISELVKRSCTALLTRARDVDSAAHDSSITSLSEAAARLLKVLLATSQSLTTNRQGTLNASQESLARASTAVFIANALFRTYHQIDSMHLFTSVVQPMRPIPPLLDHIPKADAVEYRYWLGRYKLSIGNVQQARELLLMSFRRCRNSSNNKRLILIYLTTASLTSGFLPDPALLSAFNLQDQFDPVVQAVRKGDGFALRQHLDRWMQWFAKKEILFVLREKMDPMIWRTVCRKAALVTDPNNLRQEKDVEVSLKLISEGLKLSYRDASYDWDDAEMIVVCLIDQGYIRGGIAHHTHSIKRFRMPPASVVKVDPATIPDLYSL